MIFKHLKPDCNCFKSILDVRNSYIYPQFALCQDCLDHYNLIWSITKANAGIDLLIFDFLRFCTTHQIEIASKILEDDMPHLHNQLYISYCLTSLSLNKLRTLLLETIELFAYKEYDDFRKSEIAKLGELIKELSIKI